MENTPDLFTEKQLELLIDVLDQIIPEGKSLPSAGTTAANFVAEMASRSNMVMRTVMDVLNITEASAGSNHSKSFLDIPHDSKELVLKNVEESHPEMFSNFVSLVYDGYYTNESVIALLGSDAGMPQPTGFPVPPFNPEIVANVRKLGPRFRSI